MSILGTLAACASLPLFLLPGALLVRRWRLPLPVATAFALSAMLWFSLLLGAQLAGVPLTRGPMLGAWMLILVFVALAAGRRRPPAHQPTPTVSWQPEGADWIWAAAAAVGLGSIIARALLDPLSGWDHAFRWDYLAQLVSAQGNLNFYPPRTTEHFEIYAWADGMPPLVAALHLWSYWFVGDTHAAATAVWPALQAFLVAVAIGALGRRLWGPRGGWPAISLLATSALVVWGFAMGQEIGLLTVSVAGLIAVLAEAPENDDTTRVAVAAALFASLGALSREYGLTLIAFGCLGLFWHAGRSGRIIRAVGIFLLITTASVAPWYARNWVLTGNPIYPLDLFGVFPIDEAYHTVMEPVRVYWAWSSGHIPPLRLAQVVTLVAGFAFLLGVAGLIHGRDRLVGTVAAGIALFAALWMWSVPHTAGGWAYALRVLAPAVALMSALGAWVGARAGRRSGVVVATLALLIAVDAGRRAWLMPIMPLASPWPYTFAPWDVSRSWQQEFKERRDWEEIAHFAGDAAVIVDAPIVHTALTAAGARAWPYFSPAVGPVFEVERDFAFAVQELRAAGAEFVFVSADDPVIQVLITQHAFLRSLLRHEPVRHLQHGALLYDLREFSTVAP